MPNIQETLTPQKIRDSVRQSLSPLDYQDRRVLLVIPDRTRLPAPLPLLFDAVYQTLRSVTREFDVLFARGTSLPMSEAQMCEWLGIKPEERGRLFFTMRLTMHDPEDAPSLTELGTLEADEVALLTEGLLRAELPVTANVVLTHYDRILLVGPIQPDVTLGFTGGNELLIPGLAGPELLNAVSWLGVLQPPALGERENLVRRLINRAAQLVPIPVDCLAYVGDEKRGMRGLFFGNPEAAWEQAAEGNTVGWVSVSVTQQSKPPATTVILSVPSHFEDLWSLTPLVARAQRLVKEDGELVIYAPHIARVSYLSEDWITGLGYHGLGYFQAQGEQLVAVPRMVLAHLIQFRGPVHTVDGQEQPRMRIVLATQISPETCRRLGLDYQAPALVEKAEATLRHDPATIWLEPPF